MSAVTTCLSYLFNDVQTTLLTVLVGTFTFLIFRLINFYVGLSKYPNGPIPLPLIGNLGLFKNRMMHEVIQECAQKYGPIFTIWIGWVPLVILAKNDTIIEAYSGKKNDFAGRPKLFFAEVSKVSKDSADVVLEDWGRPWEVLRRVSHTAARRFAVNPKLPNLEVAVVDEVVDLILSKEGLNQPFDPKDYIYLMVYSILASMAAGKSYSINDAEFKKLKAANDTVIELQGKLAIVAFLPWMRFVLNKDWKKFVDGVKVALDWGSEQIDTHLSNYSKNVSKDGDSIKDFCDALIEAKIEAEANDSQAAIHLTSDNLKNLVYNLFSAGTETTRTTLNWAFLLLASFPDVQEKMRSEIEQVIGSEVPTNDHRIKCHYVQAFITEVMRYGPVGELPHKTTVDTSVHGVKVPKDTMVVASGYTQLHDESWGDPEVFRPERFIESSGTFNARINNCNHAFGIGRRACLGEKLALMSLFIQITRFLQKTTGHRIVLKDGVGSVSIEPDRNQPLLYLNVPYEIAIVSKS